MLVVEKMNLWVGNDDPSLAASKHLSISEVKLPNFEEQFQEHKPGGGFLDMDISMGRMNKLETTFKLVGVDPALHSKFLLPTNEKQMFTFRGHLKNKISGKDVALKVVMDGRLAKIEPDTFKGGDLLTTDYSVMESWHYALYFDDVEKCYLDVLTNSYRVDGVDVNRRVNAILGIG